MLKKVISLWSWLIPWGTLWWISIGIVICKWEFWFFDLLMAIFSLLECFATFHKLPILERSIAVRRACFVIFLLDRSSIKNQEKKWPKKSIGPSVFAISVCLSVCVSVCLSVSALQVTVFVVGSWFLAWGILEWNPKNAIFCFWKFWDLT